VKAFGCLIQRTSRGGKENALAMQIPGYGHNSWLNFSYEDCAKLAVDILLVLQVCRIGGASVCMCAARKIQDPPTAISSISENLQKEVLVNCKPFSVPSSHLPPISYFLRFDHIATTIISLYLFHISRMISSIN